MTYTSAITKHPDSPAASNCLFTRTRSGGREASSMTKNPPEKIRSFCCLMGLSNIRGDLFFQKKIFGCTIRDPLSFGKSHWVYLS